MAVVVVLLLAIVLRFTLLEFVFLTLSFATVIAAELFNTAFEVLIDHLHPEEHPLIGRAKDVSAAAVLVTALGTGLAGILLFAHHLFGIP